MCITEATTEANKLVYTKFKRSSSFSFGCSLPQGLPLGPNIHERYGNCFAPDAWSDMPTAPTCSLGRTRPPHCSPSYCCYPSIHKTAIVHWCFRSCPKLSSVCSFCSSVTSPPPASPAASLPLLISSHVNTSTPCSKACCDKHKNTRSHECC